MSFAGTPSPSGHSQKPTDAGGLQRTQTLGQKIMDNLFARTFTSKSKGQIADVSVPSSPSKVSRNKCLLWQLLVLYHSVLSFFLITNDCESCGEYSSFHLPVLSLILG